MERLLKWGRTGGGGAVKFGGIEEREREGFTIPVRKEKWTGWSPLVVGVGAVAAVTGAVFAAKLARA